MSSEVLIAFLNVGQGDANVVVFPDSTTAAVIDCFSNPAASDYLRSKGVKLLRYAFLTHSDQDHANAIVDIVEAFMQEGETTLLFNKDRFLSDRAKYREMLRRIVQLVELRGLKIVDSLVAEKIILEQDVLIEVLHPSPEQSLHCLTSNDVNNASALIRVSFTGKRVLFAADIQGKGWKWAFERSSDLQADVLKFPHHGAWYQATGTQPVIDDVISRVSPNLIVLSVGTNNRDNHPHPNTLSMLKTYGARFVCTQATRRCHSLLRPPGNRATACAGTVEVLLKDGLFSVKPEVAEHDVVIDLFDNPQCRAT